MRDSKSLGKVSKKNAQSRIAAKVLSKSDIGALTKLFNSSRWGGDTQRNADIRELKAAFDSRIDNKDFFDLTQEQTDFGIEWLHNFLFTGSGKLRQGKCVGDFDNHEALVIRNFSGFQLVGLKEHYNGIGTVVMYSPIYRTYDKLGNWFDYAPVMWGVPELIDYNYSNKAA